MKNLKCKKSLFTLLLTSEIILTSCTYVPSVEGSYDISPTPTPTYEKTWCEHLVLNFGEPVIFKECEGYKIKLSYEDETDKSVVTYKIYKGNEIIVTGKTTESHIYNGMHEYLDEIESEKVKVYKINRPESNN